MAKASRDELRQAIDTVKACYEFTLAYAAQGVSKAEAARSGAPVREHLAKAESALEMIAGLFEAVVREEGLTPVSGYESFFTVLREDAHKAGAAVRLTLAQPAISSQLIDHLNASIHLRALLSDLFLIDEILAGQKEPPATD